MSDPSAPTAVAALHASEDRAFFGHPRGLALIFGVEMWERFSYYGMRAILVLYLVNGLRWDTARAAGLYGTYTMAVYLTPLAGGYLADRWIGTRRSLFIGGLVIAAGHFALAFPGMGSFYLGLSLIVIGTGFFKPNASTIVGQLYAPGDARRDAGFTLFYMGINLGALLGPLACGYLAQSGRFGWHWGFAAAGVGMVLGLGMYVWGRERYLHGVGEGVAGGARQGAARPLDRSGAAAEPDRAAAPRGHAPTHAVLGAAAGAALAALLTGVTPLGMVVGAAVGATFGVTVLGTRGDERRRVLALFIIVFFVIFFWAAYEQTGSSMNLFADKNTDLGFFGWTMPSSWFQSFNPLFILIFAPLFAELWQVLGARRREPSTALKMVLGLFLLGAGFLFMLAGGARADAGVLVSPILADPRLPLPHLGRALPLAGRALLRDEGRARALRLAAHGRLAPRERGGEQDRGRARRLHAGARRGPRGRGGRPRRVPAARLVDLPRLLLDLRGVELRRGRPDAALRPAPQAAREGSGGGGVSRGAPAPAGDLGGDHRPPATSSTISRHRAIPGRQSSVLCPARASTQSRFRPG